MAMSIASQASIAIQNAQLVKDIQNLFNGFIKASVKAIESRDPTTSGHSQRVADLTVALAEQVSRSDSPRFRDLHFSESELQELRYASLLHDFGKIGVRENVLIKAKKLYPAERQSLEDRFHLIKRTTEVHYLQRQVQHLLGLPKEAASPLVEQTRDEQAQRIREIEEFLEFILKCNEPTVLAQGGFERLHEIAAKTFQGWDGSQIPFLSEKELISLSVPKGSLNENDRKEIESHVTHTYKFLNEIPWTKDLRRVPLIAYAHHEKLDGTGYPNKLTADQIPLQSKMMTISDIFDALTAWDRPYKKAVPMERALNILVEESNVGHIDKDLLDIFIQAEIFKLVEVKDHP
jgi:HD-GYP domain-containing protein (c-di-GMP phosphodiesterase class II)